MLDVINFNYVESYNMYTCITWLGEYSADWGMAIYRNKQRMQNFHKIFVDVSNRELVEIILVGFDFFELPLCLRDIDRATVGL